MDLITSRSKELLDTKGPLSHGFYTWGQLMLEEYYTLAVIGKAGIGTPHMDGNTRLCTATAAASLKESFGADGQPGCTPTSMSATPSSASATTWRDPDRAVVTDPGSDGRPEPAAPSRSTRA